MTAKSRRYKDKPTPKPAPTKRKWPNKEIGPYLLTEEEIKIAEKLLALKP